MTAASTLPISYLVQFISKFVSGAAIDYWNKPKLIYIIFSLTTTISLLINIWWYSQSSFLVLYPIIKGASSFARITALKILATWYPKEVAGMVTSFIQAR